MVRYQILSADYQISQIETFGFLLHHVIRLEICLVNEYFWLQLNVKGDPKFTPELGG